MKGVLIDANRLARLAEALREQIPNASTAVARPMIDAAGELQRMADEPHGRVRYMAGCRCGDCRRANTEYARMRRRARARGEWNGLVDATAARLHLRKLSRQGVGRRAVSAATDIRDDLLFRIRTGRVHRIHASTEQKILAVTPIVRSDRALVPAARTWRLINELIEEGWTKKFIAKQLGYSRALQLNKHRVTVKNAARVERLYRRLMS